MAITSQPTTPDRNTQTQQEFSINAENTVTWQGQFADELNAASSTYLLGVTSTSTTSNTIGTGSKTFTIETGLGFVVGNSIRVANDGSNYMTGDVVSYTTGTGVIEINITSISGSGTYTSWTLSLSAVGASASSDITVTPSGNITASNVQTALEELDTLIGGRLSNSLVSQTAAEVGAATDAIAWSPERVAQAIAAQESRILKFESPAQSITSGSFVTVEHGLPSKPFQYFAEVICTTAEHGFSIGATMIVGTTNHTASSSTTDSGVLLTVDDTDIVATIGDEGIWALDFATNDRAQLTDGSWELIIKAWV